MFPRRFRERDFQFWASLGVILPKKKGLPQELPQTKCFRESFCEFPCAQWEPLFREVVAGRFPMLFPYVGNFPLAPPCSTTEICPEIFDLPAECFVKNRSCFIVCCLDEVFVIKLCWVLCLDARTTCLTQHHDGVRPVFSIEHSHRTARLNARSPKKDRTQLCKCMQTISNCDGCTKTHRRPQTATKCKQL